MAYENIPGVRGTYLDGAFRTPTGTTQPNILVLGSATSGLSYELFNVTNVRQAESEFGADVDVLRGVHECVAQRADNVSIMRIGGRQGRVVLTDANGGTLTIVTEFRDDEILDRYALVMDGTGATNRILVWDFEDEAFVFDSSEIEVLDEGIVDVEDTGLARFTTRQADLITPTDINDPTTFVAMDDLVVAHFNPEAAVAMTTVALTDGTDGTDDSLVERYAALNTAYHLLDFRDADFVVPQMVFIDDRNMVTDTAPTANFWMGVPTAGDITDELGWVWQYIYQGRLYTYFVDRSTYFTDLPGVAATLVIAGPTFAAGNVTLTATKIGVGGNEIEVSIANTLAAPISVVISEPDAESLRIAVVADAANVAHTSTAIEAAIDVALAAFTTSHGVLASTLVTASSVPGDFAAALALTPLAGGLGGAVLTHTDLTGEVIPAAVTTVFNAGTDNQLREVNFAHQLASFCERASTTWKTMLGAISFREPPGFSRPDVSEWAGNLPTYVQSGDISFIDAAADNGTGILGNKFLAGRHAYRETYLNDQIDDADADDGLGFGGFIKTVGATLPNAEDFPDFSYGVDDTDEAEDAGGIVVDIGKHLFVTYDWPILRNNFNSGTNYRGYLTNTFFGKVATMPENEEPIGANGLVRRLTAPPRVHATQQDQLALIRAIGLRREEGRGFIIVSAKTAAHPLSDYTRISTIRSVNRELQGIRRIAAPFIGKDFSAQRLVALQSAIDGFLQAETAAGFNQGARASISFTRSDRIMGRLTVKLRMVPPFSIQLIEVETSLAAEESEL